jgi:tetratricopeptide (TPR) repeat protein
MQAGQYENALQVYDQHAERMLAEDSDKVLKNLHSVIGHVRDNHASLEKLLDLFHKAGDTSHTTEVIELLAHASVQSGDLPRARDLYQKLATMEPGNPLHMNNYQQVAGQIGGDSGATLISVEEAAVIVDELEATAPSIHQHYSDAVALAVRSALTDAELFISYNMPAKALGPLLAVLPQAPTDLRLNQRLASLHTRAERFAEAGVCCRTLQEIYSEAGYPEEATRYRELADRYQERSGVPALSDSAVEDVAQVESAPEETSVAAAASAPWPAPPAQPAEDLEFAVVGDPEQDRSDNQEEVRAEHQASPVAESDAAPAEIDLSSEWDDSLTVEADTPAEAEITHAVGAHDAHAGEADEGKAAETVEEIRFYLEHGMPEQAAAAFEKLQTVTRDETILSAMEAEIQAAAQPASATEEVAEVEAASEFTVDEPSAEVSIDETPAAVEESPAVVEPVAPKPPAPVAKPVAPPVRRAKPVAVEPPVEPAPAVLQEFVSDLESSLGENFLPGTVSHEAETAVERASGQAESAKPELEPIGNAAPTTFGVLQPEPMGEFVADLEASLGDDFLQAAPTPEPRPAPKTHSAPRVEAPVASAPAQPRPVPASAPQVSVPIAAAAAASSGTAASSPQMPVPQKPAPAVAPQISPGIPSTQPAPKFSPFGEDAGVDLAEMFGELKHDLEVGASTTEEDPETHYNLGIAFREMGLLDEAIGELQKTCQAVERGHAFPQVMQTYTWLAQCFLDKGLPEAAIRWYQKALSAPGIDEETRTALHYELAAAYETAGDKPSALKHFMEVYGRNIDYRDVAERIKPLKS